MQNDTGTAIEQRERIDCVTTSSQMCIRMCLRMLEMRRLCQPQGLDSHPPIPHLRLGIASKGDRKLCGSLLPKLESAETSKMVPFLATFVSLFQYPIMLRNTYISYYTRTANSALPSNSGK